MEQIVHHSMFEEAIKSIIAEHRLRSILLVTGQSSYENSSACAVFSELSKTIAIQRISDFDVNPSFEDVVRIKQSLNLEDYDAIVSIGGGSVMDFAKLLLFYAQAPIDIPIENTGKSELNKSKIHIAIPTTAGSGSEATHFAVMYKNGIKYSIAHKGLLPHQVVLDSSLTSTKPKHLTACSGMDALCQAIESLWAKNATAESKQFAKEAIKLIVPTLLNVTNEPNAELRERMLSGAHLAGKAINLSKTTAPHALAYYLTKKHGISHGEAVGINIDFFLVENWPFIGGEESDFLCTIFNKNSAIEIAEQLIQLKKELHLKTALHTIENLDLEDYLQSINLERMGNNPRQFQLNELKNSIINYHNL